MNVENSEMFSVLDKHYSRLIQPSKQVLVIAGSSGSGRTALLATYLRRASSSRKSDLFVHYCCSQPVLSQQASSLVLRALLKSLLDQSMLPWLLDDLIDGLDDALKSEDTSDNSHNILKRKSFRASKRDLALLTALSSAKVSESSESKSTLAPLAAAFAVWVERIASRKHAFILVEDLEMLFEIGKGHGFGWLPVTYPLNFRVVYSVADDTDILDYLVKKRCFVFHVSPPPNSAVHDKISSILVRFSSLKITT